MEKVDFSITKSEYSSNAVVPKYIDAVDSIGLWESEKIIFTKYISKKDKILDIGCGAGRTTFNLYDMGYKNIIGLDLSPEMIDGCKARAKAEGIDIEFINANACKLPFEDRSFDACIFSFNGLMTIPKREIRREVLCEVSRILKTGGCFIFTSHDINNPAFLEFWAKEKDKWEKGEQNTRFHEYGDLIFADTKSDGTVEAFVHMPTRDEVVEEIKNAGLTLVYDVVRSCLCEENEAVKNFSLDCIFWICRKDAN